MDTKDKFKHYYQAFRNDTYNSKYLVYILGYHFEYPSSLILYDGTISQTVMFFGFQPLGVNHNLEGFAIKHILSFPALEH